MGWTVGRAKRSWRDIWKGGWFWNRKDEYDKARDGPFSRSQISFECERLALEFFFLFDPPLLQWVFVLRVRYLPGVYRGKGYAHLQLYDRPRGTNRQTDKYTESDWQTDKLAFTNSQTKNHQVKFGENCPVAISTRYSFRFPHFIEKVWAWN